MQWKKRRNRIFVMSIWNVKCCRAEYCRSRGNTIIMCKFTHCLYCCRLCHQHRYHQRHWHHDAYTSYFKWRFMPYITHSNLTAVIITRCSVSLCSIFHCFRKKNIQTAASVRARWSWWGENSCVWTVNTIRILIKTPWFLLRSST